MNIYTHNGIFLNNSETEQYYRIVTNAQTEQRKKHRKTNPNYVYYESHHILPRSIFPEFAKDKWNLVYLTAKEHLLCHQLLVKMIAKSKPYFQMVKAYQSMAYRKTKDMPRYELTPDEYEELRIMCSEASAEFARRPCSDTTKARISAANKGRKPNSTAIENSVKARIGKKKDPAAVQASANAQRGNTNVLGKTRWNNGIVETLSFTCPDGWVKGRLPISEETRRKISEAGKGRVQSDNIKKQKSEKMKGYKWPTEFGQKISASKKGVKTNQQEIMGRRYAAMSLNDFESYKSKMKSLLAKNRATNLRNKWILIIGEG